MISKINYGIEKMETLEATGGCTECSVGCRECWARKEVWRMAHNPLLGEKWKGLVEKTPEGLRWTGKIKLFEDVLQIPLKRKKPTTYFVDSKADLFHPKVPFEFIDKVFGTMILSKAQTSRRDSDRFHKFLLLTKRPKIMLEYYKSRPWLRISKYLEERYGWCWGAGKMWHPDNVHLGATICTPDELWKAEELLKIPAAYRWASFEPLLKGIKLPPAIFGYTKVTGDFRTHKGKRQVGFGYNPKAPKLNRIIVGCESGPKRRPCKLDHIRSIVRQCDAAGAGCYVKQIEINGKVEHDINKFPKWAQVRETI